MRYRNKQEVIMTIYKIHYRAGYLPWLKVYWKNKSKAMKYLNDLPLYKSSSSFEWEIEEITLE
jgi:hypothetical protein